MTRRIATQVQNTQLVEERRNLIINAAIEVFRRKGYHVATTKDVALAAGVTQSNLYNYISKKDDILYLLCERLLGLYNTAVEEASARFTDPHEQLVECLRAIIRLMMAHRQELVLLYNDAHSLNRDDRRLVLSMISRFIGQFEQLIRNYETAYGAIRVVNRRLAANLLSFVPAVVALRHWDLAPHLQKSDAEAEILGFLLAGLGVAAVPVPRTAAPASAETISPPA